MNTVLTGSVFDGKYTLLKIQVEQDRRKNLLSKWSCLYFLDASIFNQESGRFPMENKPEIRYFIIYICRYLILILLYEIKITTKYKISYFGFNIDRKSTYRD